MVSRHFKIHELVPEELYRMVHEEVLWRMVPDELIRSIDQLKDRFSKGTMTINNYEWSGNRRWSGLRLAGKPYYSPTSQHTKMNAIDAVFSDYSAEEVRKYILSNSLKFPHIGGVELEIDWVHLDIRPRRDGQIITFRP